MGIMGEFQLLYIKVLNGNACCTLEGEEGTGCDRECPYAGTDNCKDILASDEGRLRNVMRKLDELNSEIPQKH